VGLEELEHKYHSIQCNSEGYATLESCYHYDSFMFGLVTGMKTAGRIIMAVSVTGTMLDVISL
jgi:hypothetical protein